MTGDIFCSKCNAPNPPETVYCGKCGEKIKRGGTVGQPVDPLLGSFVGDRFLVHEKLGEGGMGVVYRAEQTAIQRAVALKVLHSHLTQDESLHARFQNEAAASSRLTHPNTVTIYDFGKTKDGALYIAMEFVQGSSLDSEIRKNGALDWRRACRIAVQICGSLSDAHHHSIVHRDLKPENIMLCSRGGETDVVKVLDFGIAKILEDEGQDQRQALTKTGMVFGTPQYMSPEQIRGEKVDHRTDIYSLGVILYEMLMGTLPFVSEMPMGVLSKHLVDPPPPFREKNPTVQVPAEVEAIIMSTLSKQADDRPQTMKDLAAMLAEAVGTLPMESPVSRGAAAETVPTPSPGAAKGKKKEPAPTPPKTLKQPAADRPGVAPAKKSGAAVGIGIAIAAVVVIAGGVGGWYFLAGPGAGQGTAQPSTQPVAVAQPPINPTIQQVPATQPPAYIPPSADTASDLPAVPSQPTVEPGKEPTNKPSKKPNNKPNIDPDDVKPDDIKPDDIKPDDVKPDDKPVVPDPVKPTTPQDVKCSISGNLNNPVGIALIGALKFREKDIKQCAKQKGGGTTKFEFVVEKGANKLSDIKAVNSSAMDACLKQTISGTSKFNTSAKTTGTVTYILDTKDGAVTRCNVSASTKSDKPIVLPKIPKRPGTKK